MPENRGFELIMFILLAGALSALFTFLILRNSYLFGAFLFSLDLVLSWHIPNGLLLGSVGNTNFFLRDLLILASFLLFFTNLLSIDRRYPLPTKCFLVLLALTSLALARGMAAFGLQTSVNEARDNLGFLAIIAWSLYSVSAGKFSARAFNNFVALLACSLLLIEALNLALYGFGSASEFVLTNDGFSQTNRPIVSVQALALVMAVPVLLTSTLGSSKNARLHSFLASLALLGAIVAQHRSVWFALAASTAIMTLDKRTRKFALYWATAMGLGLSIIISGASLPGIESLRIKFLDSLTNQGTLFARTGSWNEYLSNYLNDKDLLNILFGSPYGTGWGRHDGGTGLWVEFNPHNWYVIVLLRFGAIGALVFMAFYFSVLRSAVKVFSVSSVPLTQWLGLLLYQGFYTAPWQAMSLIDYQNGLKAAVPEHNSVDPTKAPAVTLRAGSSEE